MGRVEAFNEFMGRLWNMEDSKHEKGTEEAIVELESLIQGHHMGSNSPGKSELSGSLSDRITKTMIYGKERNSETDLKSGKIKKDVSDFAKQVRNKLKGRGTIQRKKQIQEKRRRWKHEK